MAKQRKEHRRRSATQRRRKSPGATNRHVGETDAQFWAQTHYKPGQKLDPHDPTDRKMISVWIDLYRRVREAAALRDNLGRELGAPQVMTVGEQIVWAAEFVRALAARKTGSDEQRRTRAADVAAMAVLELRAVNWLRLNVGARSMYTAMVDHPRHKKTVTRPQ